MPYIIQQSHVDWRKKKQQKIRIYLVGFRIPEGVLLFLFLPVRQAQDRVVDIAVLADRT